MGATAAGPKRQVAEDSKNHLTGASGRAVAHGVPGGPPQGGQLAGRRGAAPGSVHACRAGGSPRVVAPRVEWQ
eukprot:2290460-Lingulodinium_polyedra.AAC.1